MKPEKCGNKQTIKEENTKKNEGDDAMGNVMTPYATLDLQSLMQKKGKIVSSEEALRDVKPIEWEKQVLQGRKKVVAKEKK